MSFIAPYEAFETLDEPLFIATPNDNLFQRFAELLGAGHIASDPRFSDNAGRVRNRLELRTLIQARLREKSAESWETLFRASAIPCSRIHTVGELVEQDQFRAVDMLVNLASSGIPDLRLVNTPIRRDGGRSEHRLAPPMVGEHSGEILRELGFDEDRIELLVKQKVIEECR
jgi:crotonobetainyl-CoA:carnitine CoA-transferase CaiB-like acyl-CoA transferase